MESRRASVRLTHRTGSLSTALPRRYSRTKSRICFGSCNVERCLKNPELLSRLLDQKLIDLDKEKQNFYEKYYDVTIVTARNLMLNHCGIGQTWNPRIQDIRRPTNHSGLRFDVTQMKASAVPPNLSRVLEAKTESQKYEIQSLRRDLQSTQDSLNSWAGQEDGVSKACPKQAAAVLRGSRTCEACKHLSEGVAPQGTEGRQIVLPWYHQVGVVKQKTSSEM